MEEERCCPYEGVCEHKGSGLCGPDCLRSKECDGKSGFWGTPEDNFKRKSNPTALTIVR